LERGIFHGLFQQEGQPGFCSEPLALDEVWAESAFYSEAHGDKFGSSARRDLVLDIFSDAFDFIFCVWLDDMFRALIMRQPNTALEPAVAAP
jgi:hypothetical protein